MANTISPQQLYQKLKNSEKLQLLDVRDQQSFKSWHIYGSINIPLPTLKEKTQTLSKNKDIVTICQRGDDSKLTAVILQNKKYHAFSLSGGLKMWNTIYDIVEVNPITLSKYQIFQFKRLGKGCLSYIIFLPESTSAIVVDPTIHIDTFTEFLKKNKRKLIATVDTHLHADHISGSRLLSKKYSIPYLLPKLSKVSFPFKPVEKYLAKFLAGNHVKSIATPGHTRESISILLDKSFLFTGDTLFLDSIGRSDFGQNLQKNATVLYKSICHKLFTIDENIFVLPAHSMQSMVPGPVRAASLRYVTRINKISEFENIRDFVKYTLSQNNPPPPNFLEIKEINRSGKLNKKQDYDELELGANRCAI